MSRPGIVLLIHGLPLWRDQAAGWPRACAVAIRQAGAVPLTFTYPRWVGWSAFAWPGGPMAQGLVRRLAEECRRIGHRYGPPGIIAHSFGSVLITRALAEGAPPVELSGLILFGSILPEDFRWEVLMERRQIPVGRLRNELGIHDPPIRWAAYCRRMGLPYGASGLVGFRPAPGQSPIDAPYPRGDVGAASLARHCREVWLPFLGLGKTRRAAPRSTEAPARPPRRPRRDPSRAAESGARTRSGASGPGRSPRSSS